MSNLLIIEPECRGHRAGYVRWIAKAAVHRGHRVQLATFESCARHPLFLAMQEELGEMSKMVLLKDEQRKVAPTGILALTKFEFYYRRLLGRFYATTRQITEPDVVLVPYLDYCANAVALLGSPFGKTRWMGIVMRPAFHFAPLGILASRSQLLWVKKRLFLRLLANNRLRALFTIDEALYRFMHETQSRLSARFHYLQDPAETEASTSRAASRQAMGIPPSAIVILVYGAIDCRKGIDVLIRALAGHIFSTDLHVLIAGVQEEESRPLLDSPEIGKLSEAGRIRQLNRFLNHQEESAVFRASDIVWLGYRNHYGMSGVMVKAGQMGLPIIACKEGLIGWTTKVNKSGVVVNLADPVTVYEGIMKLVRNPSFAEECGRNGHARFGQHTVEGFANAIIDRL